MRIDLKRVKDIDRNVVLTILSLIVGIGISVWLVKDVSRREKAVEKLAAEVDSSKHQVDSLPQQTAEPMTPEQLSEKIGPLFLPVGGEQALREELARLASEHHLENVTINLDPPKAIDPASTEGEDPILVSLGITKKVEVHITFQAEYQNAARFLGGLETLQQRILIRDANLTRGEVEKSGAKISGIIALRVYQKDS